MHACQLRFFLGQPQGNDPAQWLEGVFLIRPAEFSATAEICQREPDETYSQYSVTFKVDQPFSAEAFLDTLDYLSIEPFTPTARDLRLETSGDVTVSKGEIARIVDPNVMAASVGPGLPDHIVSRIHEQLVRVARTRLIASGFASTTLAEAPPKA